jgi:hypothetical protein
LARLTEEPRPGRPWITPRAENEERPGAHRRDDRDWNGRMTSASRLSPRRSLGSEPDLSIQGRWTRNKDSLRFYKTIVFRQRQDGVILRGWSGWKSSGSHQRGPPEALTINLVRITGAIALVVLAIGV